MQLAILADIHGNAWALEAVLEDAARRGLREFADLGDVLYGPLAPRRTYDLLREVKLIAGVAGNQDRLVRDAVRGQNATVDFVLDDLGPEPIEWLRGLPPTATVGELLLCHGTPASDMTYLLEDVSTGRPAVRPQAAILSLLAGFEQSPVILCGHTHIPRLIQLIDGPLILNPGSVGLPAYDDEQPVPHFMETFSPHAIYAVIEKRSAGWATTFHCVPYDAPAAAKRARELGRPDWAQGIEFGRMQ